jgi:hypothetical protein
MAIQPAFEPVSTLPDAVVTLALWAAGWSVGNRLLGVPGGVIGTLAAWAIEQSVLGPYRRQTRTTQPP